MNHTLHLLIVDVERQAALVTWLGRRWLLPIVRVPERVRVGPVMIQWMSERRLAGRVVGQWCGCTTPACDTIDWLVVADASARQSLDDEAGLSWTRLGSLTASASVLGYQQRAMTTALSSNDLPSVEGPFGTIASIRAVEAWIADTVASVGAGFCDRLIPMRATAYERVLEVRAPKRTLYFKGLSADRADEAAVTLTLASMAANSFPHTLAMTTRGDGAVWWLMDACPGTALAACPSADRAVPAVAAFARLQQMAREAIASGRFAPVLTAIDLAALASWAGEFLPAADRLAAACDRVRTADLPWSWIWTDFDPANVFIAGDQVRFIDLDDSIIGPAPLAASIFARRLRRAGVSCDVHAAYERAWHGLSPRPLDWPALGVVSQLVECHADWCRVVTQTERGEIQGILDAARDRIAARLGTTHLA